MIIKAKEQVSSRYERVRAKFHSQDLLTRFLVSKSAMDIGRYRGSLEDRFEDNRGIDGIAKDKGEEWVEGQEMVEARLATTASVLLTRDTSSLLHAVVVLDVGLLKRNVLDIATEEFLIPMSREQSGFTDKDSSERDERRTGRPGSNRC